MTTDVRNLGVSGSEEISSTVVQIPLNLVGVNVQESQGYELFHQYLKLRQDVFTVQKKWRVWLSAQNDLDQYDQHDTCYVLAYERKTMNVVGGARLLRTDRGGQHPLPGRFTYMIRDAQRGLLDGLPTVLCDDVPACRADTWELTRLVTNGSIGVGKEVLRASNAFLASRNAKRCMFLGPPAFMKMARSMGYNPVPMGKIAGNKDGRFVVFSTEVIADDGDYPAQLTA